jgi:hypothetical protein
MERDAVERFAVRMARFPRSTTARTASPARTARVAARPARTARPARLPHPVPAAPAADDAELSTALHCVAEFGQGLRNADTKAAALASAHGLLLTLLISGFPGSQDLSALPWPLLVIPLSCVGLSLVAGGCLLGTQLPRLNPPAGPGPSPLAIPTAALVGGSSYQPANPATLTAQAWQQAFALAGIAVVKFRWLRRATAVTVLTLVVFLAWVSLSLVIAP